MSLFDGVVLEKQVGSRAKTVLGLIFAQRLDIFVLYKCHHEKNPLPKSKIQSIWVCMALSHFGERPVCYEQLKSSSFGRHLESEALNSFTCLSFKTYCKYSYTSHDKKLIKYNTLFWNKRRLEICLYGKFSFRQ